MDFGGGFAVGIAVGMGSGISTGIASGTTTGKRQAMAQVREHIDQNGISIHDRYGKPIKLDEFMDQLGGNCSKEKTCSSGSKWAPVAVVLGIALAAIAAVFVIASM